MKKRREILLEICDKCYLNCRFCSTESNEKKYNYLNLSIIKSVLDDTDKLMIRNIQLSGGEPFLHPNFDEICKLLYQKGKIIDIYTSGNLKKSNDLVPISKSVLRRLKNYKINTLRFNLQSYDKEIHNYLTNSLSFENTLKSIKRAINIGLRCEIHLIPLKQNFLHLEEIINFLKKINISKVKILRLVKHGRAEANYKKIGIEYSELFLLIGKILELKKKYKKFIEIGSAFRLLNFIETKKLCEECQIGKNKLTITSNAMVFPCVSTKNLKFFKFSLNNMSLCDILESNNYIREVNRFVALNYCRDKKNSFNYDICPTQLYYNYKRLTL